MVSFYMTHRQNDFDVTVTMHDLEVFKFSVPKQGHQGSIKIPLEILKPKVGGYYTIAITAASEDPKLDFTMGINAIHVERR